MVSLLKKAWTEVVQPMVQRPRHIQVAAICTQGPANDLKVLIITSRDTKRWIVPKGWPETGLDAHASAEKEAWEEAGVRPHSVSEEPLGEYTYDKRLDDGLFLPCLVLAYRIEVADLEKIYPEVTERERKWASLQEAASLVHEPGLKDILLAL